MNSCLVDGIPAWVALGSSARIEWRGLWGQIDRSCCRSNRRAALRSLLTLGATAVGRLEYRAGARWAGSRYRCTAHVDMKTPNGCGGRRWRCWRSSVQPSSSIGAHERRDALSHPLHLELGQRSVERGADEARNCACHHGTGHQTKHERMAIHHFHHDDERGQWGLCDCG